jgi:hypothetical protein
MLQKYRVTLTEDEKQILHEIINKGKHGAQKRKRAQALLLTDETTADRKGIIGRGPRDCGSGLWKEGLGVPLKGSRRGTGPGFPAGKTRRDLPPWYAGRRRRAAPAGPCGYWKIPG